MKRFACSSAALALALLGSPASAQLGVGGPAGAASGTPYSTVGSSASLGTTAQLSDGHDVADSSTDLKRAARKSRRGLIDQTSKPAATVQVQTDAKASGGAKSGARDN